MRGPWPKAGRFEAGKGLSATEPAVTVALGGRARSVLTLVTPLARAPIRLIGSITQVPTHVPMKKSSPGRSIDQGIFIQGFEDCDSIMSTCGI